MAHDETVQHLGSTPETVPAVTGIPAGDDEAAPVESHENGYGGPGGADAGDYSADKIKVLEGLEAVRNKRRPEFKGPGPG
mgnify:CR=1 FL=1